MNLQNICHPTKQGILSKESKYGRNRDEETGLTSEDEVAVDEEKPIAKFYQKYRIFVHFAIWLLCNG
jgi:hypothetical protein